MRCKFHIHNILGIYNYRKALDYGSKGDKIKFILPYYFMTNFGEYRIPLSPPLSYAADIKLVN